MKVQDLTADMRQVFGQGLGADVAGHGQAAPVSRSEGVGQEKVRKPAKQDGDGQERLQEAQSLNREEAAQLAARVEEKLRSSGVALKFKLLQGSGQIQVEILDPAKEKVLRKIPADDLLKLSASMEQFSADSTRHSILLDKPAL